MEIQSKPLTNLQLEILKVFSYHLSEEDLNELRRLLAEFFANKAITAANEVWDQEKWDDKKIEELLHKKLRTPYKPKQV